MNTAMTSLDPRALVNGALIDRLGWTLLHSLWQLALVAALAALLLSACKKLTASARYLAAYAALLLMPALAAATFLLLPPPPAPLFVSPFVPAFLPAAAAPGPSPIGRPVDALPPSLVISAAPPVPLPALPRAPATARPWRSRLEPALPWTVTLWALGVLLLSLRHAGGWIAMLRLRALRTAPLQAPIPELLAGLQSRLHIRRPIALAQSLLVDTPMVIGHLRPLILFPVALLAGLSTAQLEALLAHELAHIRRHDYLLNLLQILIDTLFFYHPAVWWLSRAIRTERELACDDLAANLAASRLLYAETLLTLEERRTPAFAMAATGGLSMRHRIQRLLAPPAHRRSLQPLPLAALLLLLALLALPWLSNLSPAQAQSAPPLPAALTAKPSPSVHGKLLLPDGAPAAKVDVGYQTIDSQNHQGIYSPVPTAADGSFTLPHRAPGATLQLYALSPDHKLGYSATLRTNALAPIPAPQDLGSLPLQPTVTPDILLRDGLGKPVANADINIHPASGDNGIGPMTRLFTTDANGHLRPDGIVPNVQYKLNHPGNGTFIVAILATSTPNPVPPQLTLEPRLKIQVVDANKKSLAIKSLSEINVQMPDGGKWILGPDPVILDRGSDNIVLIDRALIGNQHAGALVTLYFRSDDDIAHVATTLFPGSTDTLLFSLQQPANPAFTLSNEDREVAADAFAGRLLDSANKPIPGAAISIHDYRSTTDAMKTIATTDTAGDFLLPPSALDNIYIQIDKPGFARNWLIARDLPKGHPFDVHLDNSTRLQLDLKRPDGSPAAGAQLTAWATITPSYMEWKFSAFPTTATADASGHIDVLIDPRTNELRISDRDLNFAHLTDLEIPAGKTTTKSITLASGIQLHARFIDSVASKPVPNVKLALIDFTVLWRSEHPGSQRTTGPEGLADWPAVMPGRRHLTVLADGYARVICPENIDQSERGLDGLWLDINPALPEITVRLEKAMRLSGTVRDTAGNPVPNATVNIKNLQTGDERFARQTDADGRFLLQVPATPDPSGDGVTPFYLGLMREPGTPILTKSAEFPAAAGTEKHLDLTYPASAPPPPPPAPATARASQPATTLTPKLLAADGRPVADGAIVLLAPQRTVSPLLARFSTFADGASSYAIPLPGTPTVLFGYSRDVGFSPPLRSPYDPHPELRLAPAVDIQLSVQLPDGSPAAGIRLFPTSIMFRDDPSPIGSFVSIPVELHNDFAVTTDAAGHALFHGLPKNATVRFDTDDPRFAAISLNNGIPLEGDASPIPATLPRLIPAASITGQLLNPENHQPLAGITVWAQSLHSSATQGGGSSTTDGAGRFTIPRLPPADYALTLGEPDNASLDFVAPAITLTLTPGEHATADFHFSRGGFLRGQVLDAKTHQPVPDAQVGLHGSANPRTAASIKFRTADAAGHFEFRVPPGQQFPYICLTPADYLDLPSQGMQEISVAEGQSATVTFNLPPNPDPLVEGTVLDPDGKPLAGATVTLPNPNGLLPRHDFTTDANGKFRLHARPGTALHASYQDLSTPAPVRVRAGEPLELRLAKNAVFTLTLTVTDDSGKPVPNASASLISMSGQFGFSGLPHKSNAAGIVRFENLRTDGRYSVQAEAPGFGVSSVNLRQKPADTALALTLALHSRSARIAGTVVDAAGKSAPNAIVRMNGGASGFEELRTDADGHFSFLVPENADALIYLDTQKIDPTTHKQAHAGDTDLILTLPAATSQPAPSTTAPASQPAAKTTAPVTGQITGQLVSPANIPVPNAAVFLLNQRSADNPLLASTTTSPTGQFSLPATTQPAEVAALLPTVGLAPPAYLPSDKPLRLQLAAPIDVQVSVQLPDGSPAANIPILPTLILFPEPTSPIGRPLFLPPAISHKLAVTTDAAGHALFRGLPKYSTVRFDIDDPRFAHISPMSQSPLEGDPALIHITLPRLALAASISGKLLNPDTHQPLANVAIRAHAVTPGPDLAGGEATTDASGNFTLSRLRPAAYTLYLADGGSWLAPNLTINLAAAQTASADFHLSHGALLRGQILDPKTRRPIPGVQLGVDGDNFGATSGADGRFEIHTLPGVLHPYIRSAPDGYLNTSADPVKNITLAESQSVDITLTLAHDPAPLIEGTILGPDNQPLPNAVITPQLHDSFLHTYTADAAGKFHLHAYTGTLLRARLNDLATTAPVPVIEGKPLTLHLQKNASFSLDLTILDESNHPLPDASFELESDYGDFGQSDASRHPDPTGAAHLDALPVDRDYQISAHATGFGLSWQKLPRPTPGAALKATLILHPATSKIAGTVLNPDSTPAPGITVTLNSSGSGFLQAQTDPAGRFSFPVTEKTFGDLSIFSSTTPIGLRATAGDTNLQLTLTAATAP